MAHPICGVDVGTYAIKVVVYEVGFRHTRFRGALERRVLDGPEPLPARQLVALRDVLDDLPSDATVYLALPGDQLSIRTLDLPFSDPRKIDQVIGFELEGQIVHELDDVVFDHVNLRSTPEGTRVLAVAARKDDLGGWLEALRAVAVEPRSLYAAPVIYHALPIDDAAPGPLVAADALDSADADAPVLGSVQALPAILDIGHVRTNLFVGRSGHVEFARTITRGGQQLTGAIMRALNASAEDAELLKRQASLTIAGDRTGEILRAALTPLVRELRQSLASFRASTQLTVGTLYLTGGTAQLGGLAEHLAAELELPVDFLRVPEASGASSPRDVLADAPAQRGSPLLPLPEEMADAQAGTDAGADEATLPSLSPSVRPGGAEEAPTTFALATAIALAASRGRREIDLRRGPFVYRASFSIVRQKALHLGVLAACLVFAAGLDVYAALSNLGSERKTLDAQLKAATQEIFGKPRTDAKAVAVALRKGFREELAPVPKATAFDLLDEISKRVPSNERIQLNVGELDIRPKKTFIKGTVDSATAVDEISTRMEEIDCFDEVTKGSVTEVGENAKQFTLNISAHCP